MSVEFWRTAFWLMFPVLGFLTASWRVERRERKRMQEAKNALQVIVTRGARIILADRIYYSLEGRLSRKKAAEQMDSFCRYNPPEVIMSAAFGGKDPLEVEEP